MKSKEMSARELKQLEPIVNELLTGSAKVKDIAARLATLGHPGVNDLTEQLRLALRLLECHETSVELEKKRQKPARLPEAGLV